MRAVARTPRAVERTEWTRVALGGAAILAALYLWGTERSGLFKDDTEYYGRLAQNLADPAHLPYTFRLLTPWLVSLLPLDTASGFAVVTLLSLFATALLVYAFMARLGYGSGPSQCALIVLLFSSVSVRMLTTPTYVDSLTYALTMASLLALLARSDLLFCLLVTLGALNRETALLLLPSYLAARWPVGATIGWRRAVLVCAVPVTVLAAVVLGKLLLTGLLSNGLEGLRPLSYTGYVQRVPRLGDLLDVYSLFGVAWLALVIGWRQTPGWLALYGALVIAQLLVSRGDESRNLSHLYPLVIPLVAGILEQARQRGLVPMILLLACMIASMVHFRWVWISSDTLRYAMVGIGSLGGAALIGWLWLDSRNRYREPADGIADAGLSSRA